MKLGTIFAILGIACAQAETQYNQEFITPPQRPGDPQGIGVLNLSGISAVIRKIESEDKFIVIQVIEGGPSEKAGLQPNDQIHAIDSESVSGMELLDVIRRLRGDPGTKVTVTIERNGEREDIEIIRDVVHLPFEESEFTIEIKDNKYLILGSEVSLKEIALALEQRASRNKAWPIIIRHDGKTPYSAVTSILEICKEKGLTNIAFPTNNQ
ncbi:MAG: PDZ domain-containing protein [Terrimicrobiaceae bacterium]|nr:PDZ domain-containing protein [Terrimicrobiaceae bacterium]